MALFVAFWDWQMAMRPPELFRAAKHQQAQCRAAALLPVAFQKDL
jgi:hypothetical protein